MSLWTNEIKNGICTSSYSFPPMNYIGEEGINELEGLMKTWMDPSVRVIVLRGAEKGKFITHFHLETFYVEQSHIEYSHTLGIHPLPHFSEVLRRFQKLPKPIIVAMNGDAMGGGFEVALAGDIRIGEHGDYRYGIFESKVGSIPGAGGIQRLARTIGQSKALEFALRGSVVPPEEALRLGIVSEVADDAAVRAAELAEELAVMAPLGLARVKRVIYEGMDTTLDGGLAIENAAFADQMLSPDAIAGNLAYLELPIEKRRAWLENPVHPEYQGK